MSLLKKLLGRSEPPKARVRICVECGMPVPEHKDWCAIFREQIAMTAKSAKAEPRSA